MLVRSAVRLIAVGSLDADVARVSPAPAQMWQRDTLAMRCGPMAVGFCGHTHSLPEGVGAIVLQS